MSAFSILTWGEMWKVDDRLTTLTKKAPLTILMENHLSIDDVEWSLDRVGGSVASGLADGSLLLIRCSDAIMAAAKEVYRPPIV